MAKKLALVELPTVVDAPLTTKPILATGTGGQNQINTLGAILNALSLTAYQMRHVLAPTDYQMYFYELTLKVMFLVNFTSSLAFSKLLDKYSVESEATLKDKYSIYPDVIITDPNGEVFILEFKYTRLVYVKDLTIPFQGRGSQNIYNDPNDRKTQEDTLPPKKGYEVRQIIQEALTKWNKVWEHASSITLTEILSKYGYYNFDSGKNESLVDLMFNEKDDTQLLNYALTSLSLQPKSSEHIPKSKPKPILVRGIINRLFYCIFEENVGPLSSTNQYKPSHHCHYVEPKTPKDFNM